MPTEYGKRVGAGKGQCGGCRCISHEKCGAGRKNGRPVGAAVPYALRDCRYQAAVLNFSAATAKRLESGWNTSPASFSEASVFFEVWATSASKADLA